jgi:hypothetical protein
MKVVELPGRAESDHEQVQKLIDWILEQHAGGHLCKLVLVAFEETDCWIYKRTDNLRLSQIAIASAAMQQELINAMNGAPTFEKPSCA